MRGNKNEAIHKMASDLPPSWLPAAARSSSALASHHSQGLCPSFLDFVGHPQGLCPSQGGRRAVMDPQEPSANASRSRVHIRHLKLDKPSVLLFVPNGWQ